MNTNNKKRSSTPKITVTPPATTPHQPPLAPGVGARHTPPTPTTAGDGYLDICTPGAFPEGGSGGKHDPRLDELREIGIGRMWQQLATTIGYDNFISTWMILDQHHNSQSDRTRIWIPTFHRYLKYQRNRYIIACTEQGDISADEIRKRLKSELGESLSITHIKRIMQRAKIKK